MSDAKQQILDAALREAVFDGWTPGMFARAATSAGVNVVEAKRLFPHGVADLLRFYSGQTDAQMQETLARDYHLPSMKIRERIATAVMVRLRAQTPHREAIRRMIAYYAMPWNAAAALKQLYATVDAMWYAAGDSSTDYNFYTKRLLLAKVYSTTVTVWLDDASPDLAETQAFLYRRIENVMQIEKLKSQVITRTAKLKDWLPNLSAFRAPKA